MADTDSAASRGGRESSQPVLSEAYDRGVSLARRWHENDVRKVSGTPYIAHLLAVSAYVLEACGDETQAIAALFHDALEDAGDMETYSARRTRIREEFGDEVLAIVEACTDGTPEEKRAMECRDRKERYLSHLRETSERHLLVSAADKLHNARAILYDVRRHGPGFLDAFNAPREETLWYYRTLAHVFVSRLDAGTAPGRLAGELGRVVAVIECEVGETEAGGVD